MIYNILPNIVRVFSMILIEQFYSVSLAIAKRKKIDEIKYA